MWSKGVQKYPDFVDVPQVSALLQLWRRWRRRIGWRYPHLTLFIRLLSSFIPLSPSLSLSPVANIFITTRARDSIAAVAARGLLARVLNFQWEIAP